MWARSNDEGSPRQIPNSYCLAMHLIDTETADHVLLDIWGRQFSLRRSPMTVIAPIINRPLRIHTTELIIKNSPSVKVLILSQIDSEIITGLQLIKRKRLFGNKRPYFKLWPN